MKSRAAYLEEQFRILTAKRFGRSSEKWVDPEQLLLDLVDWLNRMYHSVQPQKRRWNDWIKCNGPAHIDDAAMNDNKNYKKNMR